MRGWVTVTPTTDEPELRFAVGEVLHADGPRRVCDVRFGTRLLVLFDRCHTREDAEALRGLWLRAAISGTPEDPDEFYDHQLEGLRVVVDGRDVGLVTAVLHLPGQDVLDVNCDGVSRLVPFVEQIVPEVDLAAGYVRVEDIQGLFDDAD